MKRYACIFVGTSRCTLRISQRGVSGKINVLEQAEYPVDFSQRVFQDQRTRNKTVGELSHILQEYVQAARQLEPDLIDIYMSASLRRAMDSVYIYERIRKAVEPLPVHLISDEEELINFCKLIMMSLPEKSGQPEIEKNALFVSLNADGILIAYVKKGFVHYIQRISIGYRRLREMMEKIIDVSDGFSALTTEIIQNYMKPVFSHIKDPIEEIYFSSTDYSGLLSLRGLHYQSSLKLSEKEITKSYKSVKDMTPVQIQRRYPKLKMRESGMVMFTLACSKALIDLTKSPDILFLPSDNAEGMSLYRFRQTKSNAIDDWIEECGYYCAKTAAVDYGVDIKHAQSTEYYALRLFDVLKKRFDFSPRMRYLIRICALLYRIGIYFGEADKLEADDFMIRRLQILGLSAREKELCAKIARQSIDQFYTGLPSDPDLTESEQLICAQLTAILKLADALDASRMQKIASLRCTLNEERFILQLKTSETILLEQFEFHVASPCFEQIFGLEPVLKIKKGVS